jgi:signal peptidase I
MIPTLATGDLVLVGPAPSAAADFHRGQIVTFGSPDGSPGLFIKRIVGLPGDKVDLADGAVEINGQAVDEPYLTAGTKTEAMAGTSSWQLGPADLFVLGDNRSSSNDSRMFGPITISSVKGHALAICSPAARVAGLP